MTRGKVLIFTSEECGACNLLKGFLKEAQDVKFIDINSPESDAYLGEVESLQVPLALFPDGNWCAVEGDAKEVWGLCPDGTKRKIK